MPVPLQHHLTKAGVLADRRGDVQAVLQRVGRSFCCGRPKGIKKPTLPEVTGSFALDFQRLDPTLFRAG